MFGFGKKSTETPAATSAAVTDLGTAHGRISLEKRQVISLTKTPKITVTISWPDTTDYDVYALVQYKDGHVETVAQFGTKDDRKFTAVTKDGAVKHLGDVVRGGGTGKKGIADEIIEIALNPNIVRVVPVAYSAQSNGTGSFRRYKVTMTIDNGAGDIVVIDAKDADKNDRVYSCVPGVITNGDQVRIEKLEAYSAPGSERRPTLTTTGDVRMDTGATNLYK
ncbi:hypothetical protein ACWGJ9_10425 [Curtobacterium citreum]